MSYQYSYLLVCLFFGLVWLTLYLWRKNVRHEMLIMSLIFAPIGLLTEIIYLHDYWVPQTITRTSVGIEDFFFGFMFGGIAAVIYEEIFKKKIRIRKKINWKVTERKTMRIQIILLIAAVLFVDTYLITRDSFLATIAAMSLSTLVIWTQRPDLIMDSLLTGFLCLMTAAIILSLVSLLTPGWINEFYFPKHLSEIFFLGIPVSDVVWYILVGMFIGPLYEYWQEGRLMKSEI